ncbi:MAG: MCE family protein [Frankiaceae bacterium]|nr:MCE family protein [Frankiaceae bacterium]
MAVPRPTGIAALIRLRLSGVAFLVVIGLLVALTVALYQKAFTPVVKVTLQANRIGNQLSAPADVKLRGLIVGEVRSVASKGNGATISLALDPSKVELIPENVEAQLIPKTLFGEKFVDLILPASPSADHLRAGDVIPQDRSEAALETERVLDNLLPLLQSLKPAQLSLALNSLSSALRGRGDRLGANFARVQAYFKELNPQLPAIQEDFQGLADLAESYSAAAPDLLRLIDNTAAVSRNTVDQKEELASFLSSTIGFADTFTDFLDANDERLITLASASRGPLAVYARYSPEYPCMAAGLVAWQPRVERSFGGLQPGLHITLETGKDNGQYSPGEEPKYLEDRGPVCYGLPKPAVPAPDINYKDGYRDGQAGTTTASPAGVAADPALYLGGGGSQRDIINSVVGPVLQVPYDEVPDIAELLFGPMARGATVGLT